MAAGYLGWLELNLFDGICGLRLCVSVMARLWPSLRDDRSCFGFSVGKTLVESPRRFLLTALNRIPGYRRTILERCRLAVSSSFPTSSKAS